MRIEQVPDNYPTTAKKRSHKPPKANNGRSSDHGGAGGWKFRPITETIRSPFVPHQCTCTWRPYRYDRRAGMVLKFRNNACPVRREHG